ncbi:MAG: patatin, partial [Microbacterium sp.]
MRRRTTSAPRRGLVIGCGGTLGFAWTAATLVAVERELGWDARTAEVLVGTSAGSEAVALLGSRRSAQSVVEALAGSHADPVLAHHLAQHPGMVPPRPKLSWPSTGLVRAGLRGDIDRTAGFAGLLPQGSGDPTWLDEFGQALAGGDRWVEHPATWLVGADVATGERVA